MLEQNISMTNLCEDDFRENIFVSLIDILRKELTIYQELKDIIIDERRILIKPSLGELNHSNALKENTILKARMLEEARSNILRKIVRYLDISIKDIKLSKLGVYAGIEQRREIEDIREDMIAISNDIKLLNESNKYLLETSLKCVNSSLEFISSMMSMGREYMESGKIRTMQNNGIFLHMEG
jgi:hypothetical protein